MATLVEHSLQWLDLYVLGQATSVDRWQLALCTPLPSDGLNLEVQNSVYELHNQLVASVRHRGEQREEMREMLLPLLADTALDVWSAKSRIEMAQSLLPAVADLAEALEVSQQVIESTSFEAMPLELQDDLVFSYEATVSLYQTLATLTHKLALGE